MAHAALPAFLSIEIDGMDRSFPLRHWHSQRRPKEKRAVPSTHHECVRDGLSEDNRTKKRTASSSTPSA
jgi:hypothetical protein